MAMTYSGLVAGTESSASIKSWALDDTIPADTILEEAQELIYRKLRVRQMIAVATGTLTSSATATDLPDRYLAAIRFDAIAPTQFEITRRTLEQVYDQRQYSTSGVIQTSQPDAWSVSGTTAVFQAAADQTYTVVMPYYRAPDLLSTGNETNFLTERAPKLIRAACMAGAAEWAKDKSNIAYWTEMMDDQIEQLMVEDDSEQRSLYRSRDGL